MNNTSYFWIDNLRAIATIGVILLHVSAAPVPLFGTIDINSWWIGNIIDGSVRFSVPIFFMVSGSLLLSKDYTLKDFFKKRFFRLIPPFIFWSLVYIIYDFIRAYYHGDTLTIIHLVKTMLFKLYNNGSSFHLWFVYEIIGLYLFIPILRKWIKAAGKNEMLYFIFIWIFVILFNYTALKAYYPIFNLIHFSTYLGYMVLGYYLTNENNKILNNKWFSLFLILIGNLITIIGTFVLSNKQGFFDTSLYVYLTLNVMLSASGVFLFFKNLTINNKTIIKIISLISSNSYGIYLVHLFILSIISKIGINLKMGHLLISIPVVVCTCLVVSTLIIYLMRKNKFLKVVWG